jgi:aquaporin-4
VMDRQTAHKYYLGGCTIDSNGATSAISRQTALVLEFFCTFVVLFVGVTVAFDKKRCKELGLAMVCAVVAGAMALAVFVSITVTGHICWLCWCRLEPCKVLGPSVVGRRDIVAWPLGFLGWPLFSLHCL